MAGIEPERAVGSEPASRPAWLVIHTDEGPEPLRRRLLPLMRRTRAAPTALRIDDLKGRAVFATDDAGVRIEVALRFGAYLISVERGRQRRGYTVALVAGTSFELHLRMA